MSVIFSIDNENNPLILNQFQGFLAGLELVGGFANCIGIYKGQSEHSWIMDSQDFDAFVRGSHWIAGQESILHVASGNKMESRLEFLADGSKVALGSLHWVTQEEAIAAGDYTYRCPDDYFPNGAYYVARKGNPDHA
jgi:hypothetical protein